jgi:ribonuclease Z
MEKELGIVSLRTTVVWHCRDAYGSCITSKDGWKISYSGDCRPSESFVKLASGSDVMIHEATMCDADQTLAVQKNHSCTCEVLSVAKQASVDRVIFTHFSRRQDSVPVHDFQLYRAALSKGDPSPASEADLDRAIIAFDLMTCSQRDVSLLPKMLPSLCRLHQVLGK